MLIISLYCFYSKRQIKKQSDSFLFRLIAPDMDENRSHMPEIVPVEREGMRVLLTSQLVEAYETTTDTIKVNFNRNKARYQEGKHFLFLKMK